MGPADAATMEQAVQASPLHAKYAEQVDRESAREKLAAKLEQGAAQARAEEQGKAQEKEQATAEERLRREADRASRPRGGAGTGRPRQEKSMVEEVVGSTMFRQVARTAAREIVRGVFGTGRRR
jgi:hypothetical protein